MIQKIITILFLLSLLASHAQGEANIWYFGENAGLDFNSGNPVAITNGQLNTIEGCATISDNGGQLLFYTDGITVWNKNHVVMPNGTGLSGDSSSTQSATIVPKPGSSTIFYVFTLDAFAGADGFRYTEVDISLDLGNGAVTSNKNVLVYTPSSEKLAIVKHANNIDFWVVTHGWNNNSFYSYLLTNAGLSATPIITNIGVTVSGITDNVWGYMKISPDGTKIAVCNSTINAELYDFDNTTGILSNLIVLYQPSADAFVYGAEFSPNSKLLYLSILNYSLFSIINQYNLNSSNIPSTEQTIYTSINNTTNLAGALQLATDNKIYFSQLFETYLGVINTPDALGLASNPQINAVDLLGKVCQLGLPPFVSSFLYSPSIQLQNTCEGEPTIFYLNNSAITNTLWNFGDGTTSTDINPTHTYTSAGTYTVSVVVTTPSGTGTNTRDIIISEIPSATEPNEMKICDTDNDGFANFDLTQQSSAILNGQSATQYQVRYFASATDYSSNIAISNPNSYSNATAFGQQTIIAEVSNNANSNCKAITNFTIQVFKVAIVPTSIPVIRVCDDNSFGTDSDGKNIFDLTQNESTILNGQSLTEFEVTYYTDSGLLNQITSPSNYVNTNSIETIFVKIATLANLNCFISTSFDIEVFELPIVNTSISLKQCDDDNDGFSVFNLTEANQLLVTSTAGLDFSYFESIADAENNTNAITNIISYSNQIVSNDTIYVRVQNANGCFTVATLNLIVSTTLIPSSFQRTFTVCDDTLSGSNIDGIATFDFSSVTPDIQALYPAGQFLDISYYQNLSDALAETNPITNTSNYNNSDYPNSQNIYVRVDSQLNNECLGLGHHVTLQVEPIPIVQPLIIRNCDDDQDGIFGFDTSTVENTILDGLTNVTVLYTDSNGIPLSSPLPNPFVTNSQTINVLVTNNTTQACSYVSTIEFIVDDLPEAFPLPTNLTTVCDDEANPVLQNGMYAFDTSTFQSTIVGTQTGMLVNYFDENGNTLPSPLPNPFVTNTQNVLVEVVNPINANCKTTLTIPFKINPLPMITLTDAELICSDDPTFTKVIDAGLLNPAASSNYSYKWYFNGNQIAGATNYTLTINQAGIYSVEVINNNGCFSTRTITVTASNSAVIESIQIKDFSNNNTIHVFASGLGDYVYSLNGFNYQNSPIFENVAEGIYTLFVKDLKGCDIKTETIYVMGAPKFFTPNNDGYNDFWTIRNYNPNEIATVSIFDRYGKLLHQFNPKTNSWDGNFNGKTLPATDYWYTIAFDNGRLVKGHFSLIR